MATALVPAVLLLGVGLLPLAGAAGSEFAIVDAYLAQSDAPEAEGDHCKRRGGHFAYLAGETPVPPQVGPLQPTNELLARHFDWHREHSFVTSGVSPDDADRYGDDFVQYHRAMIAEYDAWRVANGHPPTPPWDPATPIPPAFAYDGGSPLPHDAAQDVRLVTGEGCIQRRTEDPGIERPTWSTVEGGSSRDPMFGHRALCEFADLNQLGKAIDWDFVGRTDVRGYHSSVHSRVGGDLAPVAAAPRDPVFWAWHKYLDVAVFATWEATCPVEPDAPAAGTVREGRAVPGPAAWPVLGAAALLACRRR